MMMKLCLLVLASVAVVQCQRPPYAGSRPIGYPEVTTAPTTEGLGNRFGEDGTTTTQRLPLEANGDRELVDRLSKLPIDKQPFWLINWQALEANRQKPQTYPLKPNPFIDPPIASSNSGNIGNPIVPESNTGLGNRFSVSNSNSNTPTTNAPSNSANGSPSSSNTASNIGSIADRFSGGIEVNRYHETQPVVTNQGSSSSNHKPGNSVNVN